MSSTATLTPRARTSGRPSSRSSMRSQGSKTATPKKSPSKKAVSTMTPEEIKKDERYSNYSEMDVAQLRAAKSKCIEQMKFDDCEFIEAVIRTKDEDNTVSLISKGASWMKENLEERVDIYKSSLFQVAKKYDKRELVIRDTESRCFESIKKRHIAEITELETAREVALAADQKATIAEVINLRNQAKTLAKANDFDGARKSASLADAIQEEFAQKKMKATNEKYDHELQTLLDYQETQLNILQERLQVAIDTNTSNREAEEDKLKAGLSVFIRARLQTALAEGAKELSSKEKRPEFSKGLSAQYMKELRVIENEKELKLDFLYV